MTVEMIKSLKDRVQTLIFSSESDERQINHGIKRKRPIDDGDADDDVQIVSVKKPRLQKHQNTTLFQRLFSYNIVQSMSDWVQKKKPTFSVWKSAPDGATYDSQTRGNGFNQPQYRSDTINREDSNGGSYHRFPRVDMGAYTKGSWPALQKHSSDKSQQHLSRRSIHSHATKSTTVQTESISDDKMRENRKGYKSKLGKLFHTKSRPRFTATESVRLGEKVRYQELLQKFTTVPLEPVDVPHPVSMQQSISVPQIPRFFCTNNDSIIGSNVTSWNKQPSIQHKDRPKIKVHPSSKSTPKPNLVNGTSHNDSVFNNSEIPYTNRTRLRQPTSIDLTEDDEVEIISEERPGSKDSRLQETDRLNRTRSPSVLDYRDSQFISENWIKDLNSTYDAKARDRRRRIAEEELKARIIDRERLEQQVHLEQRIEELKIYARNAPVIEEPEFIEIESEEEEEVEEALPELSNEMENQINNCLSCGSVGEVLVDKFRLQITRGDIKTLSGLNWLNDEIINFYMNLLMERGERDGMPKVYAFNTFFYPKVMSGGQSTVKRWTRRVDVLAVDYILIPVHLGMHWCLAVINFKQKDIQYYDSMGGSNTECLSALRKYLCDESLDKKKKEFDLKGWKCSTVKDVPQQMNGSDCGMFACKFADYITREKSISFTQQHMPYFRRRMVYEIVTAKLLE